MCVLIIILWLLPELMLAAAVAARSGHTTPPLPTILAPAALAAVMYRPPDGLSTRDNFHTVTSSSPVGQFECNRNASADHS